MAVAKNIAIALHPIAALRPGRTVLDCSGPIHRDWLREALFVRGLKVLVFRRSFQNEEMNALPVHDGLQMASGDLSVVLDRMQSSVNLIVDDLGSFHFHEHPLELLSAYYDALAPDGEAWIRFPKSFWVFQEDRKRVSLQEYFAAKFPSIVKRLRASELDPQFVRSASATDDWVLLRKDRHLPKLAFTIHPRSHGGTALIPGRPHAPNIEFIEEPRRGTDRSTWLRKLI